MSSASKPVANTERVSNSGSDLRIRDALEKAVRILSPLHDTARLDAEVLLAQLLDAPRHRPYAFPEQVISPNLHTDFQRLVERRAAGEPIAYLTGVREFWSMPLEVTTATLIPRPETECLVEAALLGVPMRAAWTIADLGTGCGAVALALAKERPLCRIVATDISQAVLQVAARNAARLGLENIEFRCGSWCEALDPNDCPLIISNPPYVARADPHLSSGDVRFEPRSALVSGQDGLTAIREIVAGAGQALAQGGRLLLEHGPDQAKKIAGILAEHSFTQVKHHRDYAARDRVIEGVRG